MRESAKSSVRSPRRANSVCGWIGITCWLLIIPVKTVRHFDLALHPAVIGLAPSFLGPCGLLLVILSGDRPFAVVTLTRGILIAGSLALLLEFLQGLPLVRRIYTFDWLDVGVTLVGLAAGAVLGGALRCAAGRQAGTG